MTACKVTETKLDLFHAPEGYSLAHAVTADMKTIPGTLAWKFHIIFGPNEELGSQHIDPGNVLTLEHGSRFIYFLITKYHLEDDSTYETLHASLICMREHMRNHEIKKVAMPRICCGCDGLDWNRVKDIIHKVFAKEHQVEILVCDHHSPTPITPKCQLVEVTGNLFTAPPNYSLAHAVSADFALCKGIALQFKCKFEQVGDLKKHNKHTGNVAVVKDHGRYIYNLITKERSHEKITYPALYYALTAMREHMLQHGVTKLAIPRLGCGIDRLNWLHVQKLLQCVFYNDAVEIITYYRTDKHRSPSPMGARGESYDMHYPDCKRSV